MVSDVVSEFTAGDASCGALSSSCCKVPPSRTSLLDPRLALQTDRGKQCWSHGCVLVQCLKHKVLINALGCLFQFLKDASVHPPCVDERLDPLQRLRQVCLEEVSNNGFLIATWKTRGAETTGVNTVASSLFFSTILSRDCLLVFVFP